jgi:mannose-6-phosphate isomerase-like protein (cupin superfamily)
MSTELLWATPPVASVPHSNADASANASYVPGPGETRLIVLTFPPDSVMASPALDGAAMAREYSEHVPDIWAAFEPDHPGMHRTDTVDYGIVLEGEVWLELDDGREVHLKAHDVVVQNGTRHAWRNKSERPVKIAFVLIGAQRAGKS